ncbi:CLUMA_CG013951, isoform A [Clunio marinus]|uniref:CLUMA_CG013951, isoform A n=1 Tax=Clunio marinus TaxID=568069 RepID=A0A1J1IMA1_9DIPT|nr:CLUMA_CG013951, isoform A [Clunio marinus]
MQSEMFILLKIGVAVYEALDFNLSQEEECILSQDLHDLINMMTFEVLVPTYYLKPSHHLLSKKKPFYTQKVLIELFFSNLKAEAEIDDEGIERDSEEIDDEKFLDTKELDHILEICYTNVLSGVLYAKMLFSETFQLTL